MTIATSTNRSGPYEGNGVTTSFIFDQKTPLSSDLKVYKQATDNTVSLLTENTDYTVSLNSDQNTSPGGTITYPVSGSALAVNEHLLIVRDVSELQGTSITNLGAFHASVIEEMLDRVTMLAQQNAETAARAVQFERGCTDAQIASLGIPAETVSKYLYIGSTGLLEMATQTDGAVTLSRSVIGDFLWPRSQAEIDASVTPSDTGYIWGNVLRYGAVGDGVADDTAAIQAAINVVEAAGGGVVFLPIGRYKIQTTSLTIDTTALTKSIIFMGEGSQTAGSVIVNTTTDMPAIYVNGDIADQSGKRIDRTIFMHFRIEHEGATSYAIDMDEAPYSYGFDVVIKCNNAGFGALFLGSTTVIPDSDNFLSLWTFCDFRDFTDYGVRVNSKGHSIYFIVNKVGGAGTGAAGYINTEHVYIDGGQWGVTGVGGIGLHWMNLGAGEIEGGSARNIKFEGFGAGEYAVVIDGTIQAFTQVMLENLGMNLLTPKGTMVKFARAKWCQFKNPITKNPASGGASPGEVCEWDENSLGCQLITGYESATAPITVHASATRATKVVTGVIARSQVANITVAANLRTVLPHGVDELTPEHLAMHNGTAWNYSLNVLADDTAVGITVPKSYGHAVIMEDDDITTWGRIDFETVTPAVRVVDAGADFETTTGALAGTTGTNSKVTASPHTDGKLYVEARKGASNLTVLFKGPNYA